MPGAVFLRNEVVELRTIEEEDLAFVRDGVNDPDVWGTLGSSRPYNMEREKKMAGTDLGGRRRPPARL